MRLNCSLGPVVRLGGLLTLICGYMLALSPVVAAEEAAEDKTEVTFDEPAASPEESETKTEPARQRETTFTIKSFVIEGSPLFPPEEMQRQVRRFVGRGKTSADVEGARDALERFFHERGYPAVLVNIPEQRVESRVIRLEVIENRIGTLTITGNRWFSSDKIKRDLPSLAPGEVLFVPRVQQEVNQVNRHPDFKVSPDIQPGKTPESVDITLKVEDKSPWHGSVELNNRGTHDTTPLRLNTALRYDNLWQREHSLAVQYQMSPQKPSEVEVASGSYTAPAPWSFDDKLVLYGVWSNTKTAFAAGYSNLGKGMIIGHRTVLTLAPAGDYSHTAILGIDYKKFDETMGLSGSSAIKTPISYIPLSIAYNGALNGAHASTFFNAGLTFAFRGAGSDVAEFYGKRYDARGNYIVFTAGVERRQQLPLGCSLMAKFDGQVSDQPLISNEQYIAGGVESVRGYRESEASGDHAVHSVLEISAPDLLKNTGKGRFSLSPYVFYDAAGLWVEEPPPEQDSRIALMGSGVGVRGRLFSDVDYQVDLGFALWNTNQTERGTSLLHFKVRWQF